MSNNMADDDTDDRVGMSVEGGGQRIPFFGGNTKRMNAPVHEQLTVAALIHSDFKLDPSLTFITLRDNPTARPDTNDFIRGVIWNDDPECLLFRDNGENLAYSTGLMWGSKYARGFLPGGTAKTELIMRSHFDDLQWLHGMACKEGENPGDTKNKVLRWMEMVYTLATYKLSPDTPIDSMWLRDWFHDPSTYTTVKQLLTHGHPGPANIQHRALGSCFHILQDSYAAGHVRREPLNPGDRLPGDGLRYKAGVADRWGPILNFHTYVGQDGDDHSHVDHSLDGGVENMNLRSLDSWNGLVGCRDGLDACVKLANFWNRKAPWDEVFKWLDTEVFKLSDKVTNADHTVK